MIKIIKQFQLVITYRCNKNCSYCYAKGLAKEYGDMSIDDYKKAILWLKNNKINAFNFLGGEPTIHPKLTEMIDIADKEGIKFNIFTNGLFENKLCKPFSKANGFLINYNPKEHYTKEEYMLLHKNMASLHKKKCQMMVQFNITENTTSCSYVLDACKRYDIKEVYLDPIIPNSDKSNEFLPKDIFMNKKDMLMEFIDRFKEKGIYTRFTRPFPRCVFSSDEANRLKKENILYFKCSVGSKVIAVNPDLTVFPCLSLFFRGPKLTQLNYVEDYRQFYKKQISRLAFKRELYDECKSCIYRIRKKCQGACLCHKCKEVYTYTDDRLIIHSQFKQDKIKDFISSCKDSIVTLDKIFSNTIKKKRLRIYLLDNKADLELYSGFDGYPYWVKGFVSNGLYYQFGNNANKMLTHELCHIYISWLKKNKIPDWLEEGLCEYCAKEDNTKELKELLNKKKLIKFKDMEDCGKMKLLIHDNDRIDENICYHQSHNFVRFLIGKFGIDKILELIKGSNDDFDKRFIKITKNEVEEVEKRWKIERNIN